MDALELEYESQDAIPEAFRELYTENDGKFVISNINGLKTQKDVNNLQEALRKEREDHKKTSEAFKPWKDMNYDEISQTLDRVKELEIAADGKLDENKMNELVESRIAQKTGPLNRQIATLTEERNSFEIENKTLKEQILVRDMNETVRAVALEMKVVPTAIPDVELIARNYLERTEDGSFIVKADAIGVTPGVDVKQFLKEMQKTRPHWWPQSKGGGAGGGGNNWGGDPNPWSSDNWNITEQGKVVREKGMSIAEEMAKAVGSSIGGMKPIAKK